MATNVTFPSVLPFPVRDGFGREYDQQLRLVKMDDGGHRRRRRFNAQQFNIGLTFKFNDLQLKIWEAFVRYECNYGATSFKLKFMPSDDVAHEVKISGGAPRVEADGNDWRVSVSIVMIEAGPVPPSQITMPLWPTNIPLPLKSNYSYQVQNFATEDNFSEGGKGNSRNRFTTKEIQFSTSFLFTQAERDLFWSFVRSGLLDGTLPFVMPFYNGLGLNPIKVYLLELPKESESAKNYAIECAMGTINAPMISQSDYVDLIGANLVSDYAIDYFAENYTVLVIQT